MRKGIFIIFVTLFVLSQTAQGVVPRKWEIRSQQDFLKGKFDGISVSEDGQLTLSLREEKREGPPEEFFLSSVFSPDGTAYLGTGHGGKIYRISTTGNIDLYFKVPEMDIYCLALDKKGILYVGTSPNGKIYKITEKGEGGPFFNPPEKYIWDLLFTEEDVLLAAVGETGGLYGINPEGEGQLIFRAAQNHILSLKKDQRGNLLAGSGGNGLLYRFSQEKKASVLFESPYEEIRSIALDDTGNIYVAAGGTVTKSEDGEFPVVKTQDQTEVSVTVIPSSTKTELFARAGGKQPSAVYRVSSEGIAKRIWHSEEDLIYSLIWDARSKKLILGTGNKGRVYTLDKQGKSSLILQKESEQIYSLIVYDSKLYLLANNPASLILLHPEQRNKGEYVSRVYDTGTVSFWGKVGWRAAVPQGCSLQLQTRSGNSDEPNSSWTDWSPPYQKADGEQILNAKGRFIQFKIIFQTQSSRATPVFERVTLYFLQANLEPVITKLQVFPPNQVFLKPPEQGDIIWGVDKDERSETERRDQAQSFMLAKKIQRKGYQTLVWEAADENGDRLRYNLFIRREDEQKWRMLKGDWDESIFTFETLSYPDGIYFIRIKASDSPSNPSGLELTSEKTSRPLTIDNSLPMVMNVQAVKEKNTLDLSFSTQDTMSSIQEVHYIIHPDAWKIVFPVDGICDSKKEDFKLNVVLPAGSDNLITIKVIDSHGNTGVFRYTF